VHQIRFSAPPRTPLGELTTLPTLSSRLGRGNPTFAPVLAIVLGQRYTFAPVFFWPPYFIVFINNYLDSFLLEFCYYGIYLLSYTSSCTVMQIIDVKIQLQKSKGLNFGQSSKHALRNTQNDCHQWLSDSSRMHQIRFRPGLCPGPRWGNLRRSLRPPSRLGRGGKPPLIPHPPRRLRHLATRRLRRLVSAPPPTFKSMATPLIVIAHRFQSVVGWPPSLGAWTAGCGRRISTLASSLEQTPVSLTEILRSLVHVSGTVCQRNCVSQTLNWKNFDGY